MNKHDDILKDTDCLTVQQMQDYLKGNLDKESTREVELHIASCSFCADALEGLSDIDNPEDISASVAQMKNRLHHQFHKHRHKRRKKKTYLWMSIIIFIIIVILLLAFFIVDFKMKKERQKNKNIPKQEQQVSVTK